MTAKQPPRNPYLSEAEILQSLKQAPIGPYLQSNSMLLVVDAYDRRIERDWFTDALAMVLDTSSRIGTLMALAAMRSDLAKGTMSDEGLSQAMAIAQQQIEANRTVLVRRMGTLAELPWSTDTIH